MALPWEVRRKCDARRAEPGRVGPAGQEGLLAAVPFS